MNEKDAYRKELANKDIIERTRKIKKVFGEDVSSTTLCRAALSVVEQLMEYDSEEKEFENTFLTILAKIELKDGMDVTSKFSPGKFLEMMYAIGSFASEGAKKG